MIDELQRLRMDVDATARALDIAVDEVQAARRYELANGTMCIAVGC